MKEILIEHREIAWALFVIISTIVLVLISNKSFNLMEKKLNKGRKFHSVFVSLKKIFRIFFVCLGIGMISYLFVDESSYVLINDNLGRVIWFGLVFVFIVICSAISKSYFENKIINLSRRDSGDITLYKYINYLVTAIIYLSGIILIALAVPALKNLATAAGASAGALALIAGVASQEGISNIVGGLFIAFFKPFRIGDIVKIGQSTMGRVEDINLRHTVIKDFQNIRIVIPNAVVNKENISNYYMIESKNCEWIEVGISYTSDIDKAMDILREVCESHPLCLDMRSDKDKEKNVPKVDVQLVCLGDSSVKLKAWAWSASYMTGFKMRNQIYKSVKEAFDKAMIEIPFPHTTVVHKNLYAPIDRVTSNDY